MDKHIGKIELEELVTGSVSTAKRVELEKHIEECSECRAKLNALKEEQANFLEQLPFNPELYQIDEKKNQIEEKKSEPKVVSFPKMITSIAALFIMAVTLLYLRPSQESEMFTMKSGTEMRIVVEERSGAIVERERDIYYPNEQIQICYTVPQRSFLLLVSLDSSATLSRYFPTYGDRAMEVSAGVKQPLPNSIRLDSYIGEEKLVMVLSPDPFDVDMVETEIRNAFLADTLEQLAVSGSLLVRTISKQTADE